MTRPRILLVPEFTELEWAIAPQLAEWAEVATYDPPGVGGELLDEHRLQALQRGEASLRETFAARGLLEADRRGWDRFFVVGDAWGTATAARIAVERPGAVQGLALGHASLSFEMDGERPVVSREIWAAMLQLLRQDHRQFIRHGIVQMTRGSVDDATAEQMLARFPDSRLVELAWEAQASEPAPIGEMVREAGCPLLLAQHVGCLSFSEEGFQDAVAAFPEARVVRVEKAPGTSGEFARALREFCEEVLAAEAAETSVARASGER